MQTIDSIDYLSRHCRLDTEDLDEAREHVGRMWERHHSYLRHGRRYALRWHQVDLPRTSLSYARTSSSLHIECGPVSDSFRITLHEAGGIRQIINGEKTVSTPRLATLHAPGQVLRLETEPFRLLLLTFDGTFVREGLADRFGDAAANRTWPHDMPLDTPSGRLLRSLCRWMARDLDKPSSPIGSGSTSEAVERTLLTIFLDGLSDRLSSDEDAGDALSAARVRQIEEWIDAHFGEAITVEDLARIAGVSVRSLQASYRRHRGCSPMQAVISRRLAFARHALKTATPATTVTEVATASGFFHFGRFAERYRQRFGEAPSETLARSNC